jgi:hypothetical protein
MRLCLVIQQSGENVEEVAVPLFSESEKNMPQDESM